MNFRFKDKEQPRNLTSSVAGNLFEFPLPDVISASYLLYEFRPDLIDEVMDLLTPDNVRIAVIGKSDDVIDVAFCL